MSETLTEGAAAGDVVDATATDEGAAAPAPAAAPVATPVWDDPAVLDLVDTRAAELFRAQMAPIIPLLEQVLGGQGGPGATVDAGALNPWDDNFAGSLEGRFKALEETITGRLDQITAAGDQRIQAETVAEGEQRLKDILADDIARNGDFPTDPTTGTSTAQQLVRPLADMFFPEFADRFGAGPRAAEFAMQKAAGVVRQLVAEARTEAVTTETNRLTTLAGTHGEPGVNGAGVTTVTDGKPLTARELALKYGGRATTLRG